MTGILLPFLMALHAYDLADIIEQAIKVFDDFEVDYDATYLNTISQSDACEVNDTIEDLNVVTRKFLDQILKSFSVVLTDEATLQERITIIEGLAFINDYEEKKVMSDIFSDNDVEPIDRAVSALQLTTTFSEDELYSLIDSADIDYLSEEVGGFTPSEADLAEARTAVSNVPMDAIIKEVRRFVKYAKNDDLFLIKEIRDGMPLGGDLDFYAGRFNGHLEDVEADTASLNMILASIASGNITSEKIMTEWHDNIDRYVMDVSKISRITLSMRKQLVEFEQYEKE